MNTEMTAQPPPTYSALSASQRELEKRNFHLKTLYDVSQEIGSLRNVQEIIKNLLLMVMGTFGTRRGIICLVDTHTDQLEAITYRGLPENTIPLLRRDIVNGAFRDIGTLKDIQIFRKPQSQGAIFDVLTQAEIQAWIPFAVNQHIQGGIGLGEKLLGEPYTPDDQELLSTLANQLTIALDNALAYREIEQLNQGLEEKVRQRTEELHLQHEELKKVNQQLELRNGFIRSVFGKYVSDEVVTSLLESPEGLKLGGEKRKVSILMSDLRGFTALAERLAPEQVVSIINRYLSAMVDVILKYQGTIDEFIGDAILVIFGAPVQRQDDTERAVACAVAMQLAMDAVTTQNTQDGLPEVAMGIGVHTGEVVVGNIGSDKRAKYGVVGSSVNLTSRIESYTVGGQILISAAVQQEVGQLLDTADPIEVEAKGIGTPIALYEVRGIRGSYQLSLPERKDALFPLHDEIPVRYAVVDKKHLDGRTFAGRFVKLSVRGGEMHSEHPLPPFADIKMQIIDGSGKVLSAGLYAKVTRQSSDNQHSVWVHFTSVPSEIVAFLQKVLPDFNILS